MLFNSLKNEQLILDEYILADVGITREEATDCRLHALHFKVSRVFDEVGFFRFHNQEYLPNEDDLMRSYIDAICYGLGMAIDYGLDIASYESNIPSMDAKALWLKWNDRYFNAIHYTQAGVENFAAKNAVGNLIEMLLEIGVQLGYTEQQIVDAYFDTNTNYLLRQARV